MKTLAIAFQLLNDHTRSKGRSGFDRQVGRMQCSWKGTKDCMYIHGRFFKLQEVLDSKFGKLTNFYKFDIYF